MSDFRITLCRAWITLVITAYLMLERNQIRFKYFKVFSKPIWFDFSRKHVILIILNWTLIVKNELRRNPSPRLIVKFFQVPKNPIWVPIWSKSRNSISPQCLISWANTVLTPIWDPRKNMGPPESGVRTITARDGQKNPNQFGLVCWSILWSGSEENPTKKRTEKSGHGPNRSFTDHKFSLIMVDRGRPFGLKPDSNFSSDFYVENYHFIRLSMIWFISNT